MCYSRTVEGQNIIHHLHIQRMIFATVSETKTYTHTCMVQAHKHTHVHKHIPPQLFGRLGEMDEKEETVCQNSQRDIPHVPKCLRALYQEVSTSGPPAGCGILLCLWVNGTRTSAHFFDLHHTQVKKQMNYGN